MPTSEEIQTCINNLDSNSNVTDLIVLAAQTNDATTNRAISVAQTCDLPDLASVSVSVGTVFFVQSLCVPVVAGIGSWLGMDNQVLRQDSTGGVAWSWGGNCQGRLGDGSCTNRSSPVSVVGGFTDWSQLSAGRYHSLGLRTNGTAWGWGCNGSGRLGDNNATVTQRSSPVLVVGGITDWCQISAGAYHSLGVRQNGTAWGWGYNGSGRLGDNTTTARSSPVSVVGGFTDWCQVSACFHSLGVRQNGTAWGWGYNNSCQLGDSSSTARSSPVSVSGGFTDWCQVSAGRSHSLGVRQNGTAWAWGQGGAGQHGDNNTSNRNSPAQVIGGFTDWCQISAGYQHSIAVRQNGTAWGWGYNNQGQLGLGDTTSRTSPTLIREGFTDWCQVAAGARHSLGVRQNGTAWGWGYNSQGGLGDNTSGGKSIPGVVFGGLTNWYQVSANQQHSLGIIKY
jgi:alpha-tubulin suppressor-like RCC1 family protein